MAKEKKKLFGKVEYLILPVETLVMREEMASGKDPEGRAYEVSKNVLGDGIFVRRFEPNDGPWMVIMSEALIRMYVAEVEGMKR